MQNMVLAYKTPQGKSWTEEQPNWSQRSAESWGADFGSKVLNIRINGKTDNVRAAIKYIVGYSVVMGTPGAFRLSREPPARHPIYPNMRATKILSAVGEGLRNKPGEGAIACREGTYGEWFEVVMSILFEIPKYDMLSDSDNSIGGVPRPEYRRWTLWEATEAMETIARKGQVWTFLDPNARAISKTFVGDRFLRQAKGALKVTTFDVHVDFVKLGRVIPSNGLNRLSTVNARPFPYDAYPDQNGPSATNPTGLAQFPPGTLLCMPAKYADRTQAHPAVLSGVISAALFPRTCDVERNFLFFNPPSTDRTTIDLSAFLGSDATLIRGHNLAPLPSPIPAGPGLAAGPGGTVGQQWYTAINQNFTQQDQPGNLALTNAVAAARLVVTPSQLLYPYSDFEMLWKAPESMM